MVSIQQINKKWISIFLHIMIWAIVFSLPYLLDSNHNNPYKNSVAGETEFFYLNTSIFFFWIALFYLNSEILIPQFVHPKKYLPYIFLLIVIFIVLVFSYYFLFDFFITRQTLTLTKAIKYNLPNYLLTLSVSTVYRMTGDRAQSEKIVREIQEESLKTKLSFLRSQINPHFVFNVLNNIVALVRIKSEELEPTVLKLSAMMRYMLYETDKDKVLLKTEVEYLQSYIALQQQRLGNKVKVNVAIQLTNDHDEIECMLLIPFVENAFKHGTGMIANPQIDIDLCARDNELHLSVRNKYNENATDTESEASGIGLTNVTKRLNLLYAHKHTLAIEKKDNWYNVSLKINLYA